VGVYNLIALEWSDGDLRLRVCGSHVKESNENMPLFKVKGYFMPT
jgi:hypothetical protein